MQELWNAVDDYFNAHFLSPDPILDHILTFSDESGLPQINVSPAQGKMLYLLAQLTNAKNILEIGTLGGYSTVWLARALPKGGKVVTLEADSHHAEVARKNIAHAGFSDVVDVHLGYASDTLPTLTDQAPFDFIFVDADKVNSALYLDWATKLGRVGATIILDNAPRKGAIIQADSTDENVIGMRRAVEFIGNHPRLSASIVQTVGSKGLDGFVLIRLTE